MIDSVMPKGVEHIVVGSTVRAVWIVIDSVMPKGVEH